jgi:hypothetical protein
MQALLYYPMLKCDPSLFHEKTLNQSRHTKALHLTRDELVGLD